MITSRCGVRCDQCTRKVAVNCKGCMLMEKPFWGGDCTVKSCVEKKGLCYCGECEVFPCAMLSHMGEEQGFDPMIKVRQCQIWKEESEQAVNAMKKE